MGIFTPNFAFLDEKISGKNYWIKRFSNNFLRAKNLMQSMPFHPCYWKTAKIR